ncbi:MAG: UPF0175 family protein [Sulfuritalea sp.]|nr:UPF0175 family protein [Sulfuritalea sp.]
MTRVTLDMPESAFAALHQAPKEFAQEMRVAAAVKWYKLGRFSQGRAAEIAGLTRQQFSPKNLMDCFCIAPAYWHVRHQIPTPKNGNHGAKSRA